MKQMLQKLVRVSNRVRVLDPRPYGRTCGTTTTSGGGFEARGKVGGQLILIITIILHYILILFSHLSHQISPCRVIFFLLFLISRILFSVSIIPLVLAVSWWL